MGMLVAEIRASGLGIISRRNQKTMAMQLARMMKLPDIYFSGATGVNKPGAEQPDEDDSSADKHAISKMTPEQLKELADLEE